jgi:hypothetical protein
MNEDDKTEQQKSDRLAVLIPLAQKLVTEIEEFTDDSGKQFVSLAQRARINRILITITATSVMIDIMITVVLVMIGIGWRHNTNQIDSLTHRLDTQQTVQRQKALCPLYQIFLDSKSEAGRKAAPDPNKYDQAFIVIQQGYNALECDQFISDEPTAVSPGP